MTAHIRFWFIVKERDLLRLCARSLMTLLSEASVEIHTPPTSDFDGYFAFSTRLAPPELKVWQKKYDVTPIGVTGSLDDLPPWSDLAIFASANRHLDEVDDPAIRLNLSMAENFKSSIRKPAA
jgi:hypothetical protein